MDCVAFSFIRNKILTSDKIANKKEQFFEDRKMDQRHKLKSQYTPALSPLHRFVLQEIDSENSRFQKEKKKKKVWKGKNNRGQGYQGCVRQ